MEYNLPSSYRVYRLLKNLCYLILSGLVVGVTFYFDFAVIFKVASITLSVLIVIITFFNFILFSRQQKNTFVDMGEVVFKYHFNNFFTLNFKEVSVPTNNILNYEIEQSIFLKYFGLVAFVLSSGSSNLMIHFLETDVGEFEKLVREHIARKNVLVTETLIEEEEVVYE